MTYLRAEDSQARQECTRTQHHTHSDTDAHNVTRENTSRRGALFSMKSIALTRPHPRALPARPCDAFRGSKAPPAVRGLRTPRSRPPSRHRRPSAAVAASNAAAAAARLLLPNAIGDARTGARAATRAAKPPPPPPPTLRPSSPLLLPPSQPPWRPHRSLEAPHEACAQGTRRGQKRCTSGRRAGQKR